jgi:hypothetical protein
MHWARCLARKTEKGKAYGQITAKSLAVLEALLWAFHNAKSGVCFPSYVELRRFWIQRNLNKHNPTEGPVEGKIESNRPQAGSTGGTSDRKRSSISERPSYP